MGSTTPLRRYAFQSPWTPVAGGPTPRVDLYRQGATVTASTSISSGATVAVPVADVGAIAVGDSIEVGLLGPVLSVTAVALPPTPSVTLHNTTGSPVTVPVGARLIDLTGRPSVYADPSGATALTYPLIGESAGEVSAYLLDALYDAVLVGNPPTPDVATKKVYNESSGSTTNWSHTVAGKDNLLLVGASWQDASGMETIASITYQTTVGGTTTTQNLTAVQSGGTVDLWVLAAPIPGTGLITITWSGSGAKGAVCAATCFSYVDQAGPIGASTILSSASIAANESLTPKYSYGTVCSLLGVNAAISTTTITSVTGSVRWADTSAATPASTRMQGTAAIQPSQSAAAAPICWLLAASKPWSLATLELIPSQIRLYTDVGQSSICCTALGLNAQDFGSLTEAIDALGPLGGTLYLPDGNYTQATGVVVDRDQITLIGESQNAVIQPIAPNLFDLITVNASHFRMRNLTLDGKGTAQDQSATGKSCLVLNGLGTAGRLVLGSTFENVLFTGAPKYGLLARDAIIATFIDCEFLSNWYDGARIETVNTGCVALRFIGSVFNSNYGRGLSVNNCTALLLDGCSGEGNSLDGSTGTSSTDGSTVFVHLGVAVSITCCDFEAAAATAGNLVYLDNCYGAVVSACKFSGLGYTNSTNRGFRSSADSHGVDLRGCAFSGFLANSDSTVPANAVAALLGPQGVSSSNYVEQFGGPTLFIFVGADSLNMLGGRVNSAYTNKSGLPLASNVQAGSIVYLDTPPISTAHLQMTDGSNWKAVGGGVIAIFANDGARPAAGNVDAGTLIFVTTPGVGNTHLQMSDGSTSWINVA